MGTFELSGADGTYSILVDLEAAPIIKDENRNGHVNKAFSHRGDGHFAGVAGTYISLVKGRESKWACQQGISHRGDGNF